MKHGIESVGTFCTCADVLIVFEWLRFTVYIKHKLLSYILKYILLTLTLDTSFAIGKFCVVGRDTVPQCISNKEPVKTDLSAF
jgi:hypothetical protein